MGGSVPRSAGLPASAITLEAMEQDGLARLLSARDRAGLFLDFDGTLSDIVDDPSAARPIAGASPVLARLAHRFAVVAIVSGRSAHQLLEWLGPEIEIWGLHGAERTVDGQVALAEAAEPYLPPMRRVVEEARATLRAEGIEVEDKGIIAALHFWRSPDRRRAEEEVLREARLLAERYGLELGRGRFVVELRPPLRFSKADVVRRRARELSLRAAAVVGDDLVDLPAFDALDELAREGAATLRVAVASSEAPRELLDRADVVVEGPRGALEWLRSLVD